MELIAFAIAYTLVRWVDDRRADYRTPGNDYESSVVPPRPSRGTATGTPGGTGASGGGTGTTGSKGGTATGTTKRPDGGTGTTGGTTSKRYHPSRPSPLRRPDYRYGAGYTAYCLRHGWVPMIKDLRDGWRAAREAHAEWKATRPDASKPTADGTSTGRGRGFTRKIKHYTTLVAWAASEGWLRAKRTLPKTRRQQAHEAADPRPATTPSAPEKTPSAPKARWDDELFTDQGGTSMTTFTGDGSNITAFRAHHRSIQDEATQRMEEAANAAESAKNEAAVHESMAADLFDRGLQDEGNNALAQMQDALQRKEASEATVLACEQTWASSENALRDLDTSGKTNVEASVKSASGVGNDINWYKD